MKTVIGWREWAALPDLGIPNIKVKVDTGARTSCLHAFRIEPFTRETAQWVKFWVHPEQHSQAERYCEAQVMDRRIVTDSGGHRQRRYVITSPLVLGGKTWPIELTLTERDTMRFRMLLGRTAIISGDFIVDPAGSFLQGEGPCVSP